jgi:hypothetical protein
VNDRVTGARRALRRWFAGVTTQSIGLSGNEIARALISMMAWSMTRSKSRPDTLMQDCTVRQLDKVLLQRTAGPDIGSNSVIPVMSPARPLFPQKRTSIRDLAMSHSCPRPEVVGGHSITSSAVASGEAGTVRPIVFAVLRLMTNSNLYQNSQTLTHPAGVLPGHPLQKRTEIQWDIGAALGTDDGADESTSPQAGISRLYHRQVGRFGTLENLADVGADLAICTGESGCVAH